MVNRQPRGLASRKNFGCGLIMHSLTRRKFFALLAAALAPSTAGAAPAELFPVFRSDIDQVQYRFRRREVDLSTSEPAGTIIVDTQKRYLYFVLGEGRTIRYGIGVGREGARWTGQATISRKAKWPTWTPTPDMLALHANYARWKTGMPGGPDNPLGARAMYLLQDGVDNQFRIHGTPAPATIGQATTSGCFRMLNVDVIDLYERAAVGTRVVVMPRDAAKRNSLFGSVQ
jgi:lipoprotein-anchoring transpeptidase ErfK/SrfK